MKSKEIRKFRKSYTKYDKDCVFEGYKLAVLFDEKDEVKSYGGRWHPYPNDDGGHWWMPENKLLDQVHDNGTLVRDWLNDNEMIMGQYGKFQNKPLDPNRCTEYSLHGQSGTRYTVQWWDGEDAVSFSKSLPDGTFGNNCPKQVWMTVEEARCHWDELISKGYVRVSA